jgi:tetratricopeptide (TPR) repeat protein
MAGAIAEYRELIERNKDNQTATAQYRDNLMYALLYTHKYAELDEMLAKAPFSNAHAALGIASAAAQHGAAAGIAQADKGNVAASDRNTNLNTAGTLLAELRMYPEAAAVLQAGMGGGSDAAATARQIELYKNLKPATLAPLALSDPAYPTQRITVGVMAGTATREMLTGSMSAHAYSSKATMEQDMAKGLETSGMMRGVAEKAGLTETVLLDIIVGNMTFAGTGDDASGYTMLMTVPGSEATHFFVVKEDGSYRMVGDNNDERQIGNEVLWALEHKQEKLAKSLLDWKRDLTHKAGGDDAFAGPLLPRFWTVGSSKAGADSPEAMRLAAISLVAGSMDAKPYLAEIASDREAAKGQRQTDLDLLLAEAAVGAEVPGPGLEAAKRLLEEEPDSLTALGLAGAAYAMQQDATDWLALLAPRVAKKPKDHDLLEQQVRAYETANDFANARKTMQKVLDSGKATGNDYNGFAWMGLFDNHVGEPELKAAQQSNMMSKNSSFADLHTLACVYAAEGRTTEARQVLAQAMDAGNDASPNSEVWYALGMIYEQYGAKDAAMAAYRKVQAHEFDDHTYVDPVATYLLAQARIKALTAGS